MARLGRPVMASPRWRGRPGGTGLDGPFPNSMDQRQFGDGAGLEWTPLVRQ
jgi:hypothetical protein